MWFTEDIDKIFGEKLKKGKDWALCRKKNIREKGEAPTACTRAAD